MMQDKMFEKIRNKHFATIFSVLGVTAKQLSAAQVQFSFLLDELNYFIQY